jgi:gliding motility-associated-like protein
MLNVLHVLMPRVIPIFFSILFVLSNSVSVEAQCTPQPASSCDPHAGFCDARALAGTTCNNMRWVGLDGYWSFVGDGSLVTITVTPQTCLPNPPPGDGISAELLESCSPVTGKPPFSHNSFVLTHRTQKCKVYTLHVEKLSSCSCNEVVVTVVGGGGGAGVKIPLPINFTVKGDPCVCGTVEICPQIQSDCDLFYQWEINGIPHPEFDMMECLDLEIMSIAPILVCMTATLGDPYNPNSICDQAVACTTITPRQEPDRRDPLEVVCWEDHMNAGYQWYDRTIFSSCINPPCTTLVKDGDCCHNLIQPIRLLPQRQLGFKPVYICDLDELPYVTEDGSKWSEGTCGEYIEFKDGKYDCDTSYLLYLVIFDPYVDIDRDCNDKGEIILSTEVDLDLNCSIVQADYSLHWYDCVTMKELSQDTVFTISQTGEYCLRMVIKYKHALTGDSLECIKEIEQFVITAADFDQGSITMTGDSKICEDIIATYSLTNTAGIALFDWSIQKGTGTILTPNPETSSVIEVDWQLNPGDTGLICVEVNEECVAGDTCIEVVVISLPEPFAGIDTALCGLIYNLQGVSDIGSGVWSVLNPIGNPVLSDPQDESSQLTVDQYGTYTLVWSEEIDQCNGSDTVVVTFNESPDLSALDTICDKSGGFYHITFDVSGGKGPFTIIKGNGTIDNMNKYVSDTLWEDQTNEIVIIDANGCEVVYVIDHNCSCGDINAGTMQQTLLEVCVDDCFTIATNNDHETRSGDCTFVILSSTDVLDPSDPYRDTLEVQVHDSINGNEFCFDPSTMLAGVTYHILYLVSNCATNGEAELDDPCLQYISRPVIFHQRPDPDVGSDFSVCGLDTFLTLQSALVGTGEWSMTSGPGNAIFASTQATSMLNVDAYGTYEFIWNESVAHCDDADTLRITFRDAPKIKIFHVECDSLEERYRLVLDAQDGDTTSWSWSGNIIGGGNLNIIEDQGKYYTDWILAGDSINIHLTDQFDCLPDLLALRHECDCSTQPGLLSADPVEFCDESNTFSTYSGGQLDSDDIIVFYLHDGDQFNIGSNILAFNGTGEFGFDGSTMNKNQVYFITVRVGNDAGNGEVDTNDPCFKETEGVSVVWYDSPISRIVPSQDSFTCIIDSILLDGQTSEVRAGKGNLTFMWSGNGIDGSTTGEVYVTKPGTHQLVVTNALTGCTDTTEITLAASDAPDDFAYQKSDPLCSGDRNGAIQIQDISGGRGPYQISLNGGPFSSNTSYQNLAAGRYDLIIRDANGCELDTSVQLSNPASIDVIAKPTQYLLEGENIDLDTLIASIIGGHLDDFDVYWIGESGDSILIGRDVTLLENLISGRHRFDLVIIDKNGCTATDVLEIIVERLKTNVFIPNVITPNGDGLNDFLKVFGNSDNVSHISTYQIFDRWGEMVYNNNTPIYFSNGATNVGWDGRFNGELMNPGVYVYLIEVVFRAASVDGNSKVYSGDVTLLADPN